MINSKFQNQTQGALPATISRAASHGKVGERAMAKMKIVIKVNLRELVVIATNNTREKY